MFAMNCAPWYGGFRMTRQEISASALLHSTVDIYEHWYKQGRGASLRVPVFFSLHLENDELRSLRAFLVASWTFFATGATRDDKWRVAEALTTNETRRRAVGDSNDGEWQLGLGYCFDVVSRLVKLLMLSMFLSMLLAVLILPYLPLSHLSFLRFVFVFFSYLTSVATSAYRLDLYRSLFYLCICWRSHWFACWFLPHLLTSSRSCPWAWFIALFWLPSSRCAVYFFLRPWCPSPPVRSSCSFDVLFCLGWPFPILGMLVVVFMRWIFQMWRICWSFGFVFFCLRFRLGVIRDVSSLLVWL